MLGLSVFERNRKFLRSQGVTYDLAHHETYRTLLKENGLRLRSIPGVMKDHREIFLMTAKDELRATFQSCWYEMSLYMAVLNRATHSESIQMPEMYRPGQHQQADIQLLTMMVAQLTPHGADEQVYLN